MNSNSILNSNLLDIIFENRNKDYGAYDLRKHYEMRLLKSLGAVLALVSMFIIWQMNVKIDTPKNFSPIINLDGNTLSSIKMPIQIQHKKQIQPQIKSSKTSSAKPVIVKDYKDEKKETITLEEASPNTTGKSEAALPDATGVQSGNITADEKKSVDVIVKPSTDKSIPVAADVLPQYPGGVNELMKFLKRNLNPPKELEEGDLISVKIKFIVSYNGDLVGFNVVESGGEIFDNEVIRVLKKMPKWIPGKAAGENVSTYFVVPVKFTVSD